jgi:isopenicillin N synthase-like dioxygenase
MREAVATSSQVTSSLPGHHTGFLWICAYSPEDQNFSQIQKNGLKFFLVPADTKNGEEI